ncbi:MAG: hypothetical protein AB7O96_07045 [Pseudobdellovibrionaceae bacterium]
MAKILGLIALVVGLVVIGFTYKEFRWNFANDSERFISLFEGDLEDLKSKKLLPPEWQNIKEIAVQTTSPQTETWVKNYSPNISTNPSGNIKLEVIVIDWAEDASSGGMAQMSLIDLTSGNKIWELARTYRLNPIDEKM